MNIDFDPAIDYYKALGVAPTATADEIKKAWRKLAKQYHPDSTGGDAKKAARFKTMSAAYEVIGDEKKRAQYDQLRRAGYNQGGGRGARPGAGFGGFGGTGPGGFGGAGNIDINDLFGMFSGGMPGRGGVRVESFSHDMDDAPPRETTVRASDGSLLTRKGNDYYSDVRIPFDHAMLGTVVSIATADGRVSAKIPPGTGSGKKLRLKGKGPHGGDHFVTVHIDVPRELDTEGQRLVGQLAAHLAKSRK